MLSRKPKTPLGGINIQSKEEWKNYERSIKFLLNHKKGREFLILFELIQRTGVLSILQKGIENEDQKTISYIGARVFNDGMVAFKSCMNGYYQIATSLVRDLIEIQFLLDYFRTYPKKISEWRKSTNKKRYKKFAPHVLYKKLDERDGWTEERRKKTYQMFCEHAAHVSFPGIKLISNNEGVVLVGSFYDEKKLLNTILEIDRRLGHTVMSTVALLPNTDVQAIRAQLDLMDAFSKVFNLKVNESSQYKKAKTLVEQLMKLNKS